jgi:3-hydroxyisobutyrate dehydrogenase-like beta-hydroxyacid dehydrogenase
VALVAETARRAKVPMPNASLLHDRFLASLNKKGRGEMDWSAIALAISEEAGHFPKRK